RLRRRVLALATFATSQARSYDFLDGALPPVPGGLALRSRRAASGPSAANPPRAVWRPEPWPRTMVNVGIEPPEILRLDGPAVPARDQARPIVCQGTRNVTPSQAADDLEADACRRDRRRPPGHLERLDRHAPAGARTGRELVRTSRVGLCRGALG